MKILMIGPAFGHNILPFIEYFNSSEHDLTLFYSGKNSFENQFTRVNFVERSRIKVFIQYWLLLRRTNYDLIWYHGAYSYLDLCMVLLIKPKSIKLNINLWGEAIPKVAQGRSIKGLIYRKLFNYADYVQCNWISTYKLLKNIQCKGAFQHPWGLAEGYFSDLDINVTSETQTFTKSLPKDKVKFFWPKSILPVVRHDIIIATAKILLDKNISNFVIYFWLGSSNDNDLLETYRQEITSNGLESHVVIVEHDFVPFNDMKYIWSFMDVGLNFVDNDQLSAAVLEPLIYEKELVVCNIEPYVYLSDKYKLELNVVESSPNDVAPIFEYYIQGNKTSSKLLTRRREVIQENFRFNRNISRTLEYLAQ